MKCYLKFIILFVLGFSANEKVFAQLAVTTGAASNISTTTATLNGNVNVDGTNSTNYYFEYGTSSTLTVPLPSTTTPVNTLSNTSASSPVSSLSPATNYFFRLRAEEELPEDGSADGDILDFWTYSEVTSTAVADFQRQSASTTSITLEWTAQATDISGYLIVYTTGGTAPDETDLEQGIAPADLTYTNKVIIADASTTSTTITGLTANSDYSFRIIPYNVGSDPATTNYKLTGNTTLTTYTLETVTSNAIADFGVRSKGNNNIELEWTSETTDNDGYLILWATGPTAPNPATEVELGIEPNSQPFSNKIVRTGSSSTNQDITGLLKGTEYSFVIIPYNTGADPSTTNYNVVTNSELSAYTLANEPTTDPTNPARDIPDVTEMSITYDEVADADGYLILYKTGNNAPNTTGVVDGTKSSDGSEFTDADGYLYVQGSASTNPTITDLTEATEYSFRIIAFAHSADEPSTYNYKTPGTELISAYTLADQPTSSITGITKEAATTTSIDLSFDDFTFPAGGDGFYVAYYQAGSTGPDITDLENGFQPIDQPTLSVEYDIQNTDNTYAITADNGLTAGNQYSFKIVPANFKDNLSTSHYRSSDAASNSFWTLQTEPSSTPANPDYVSKTDGSITLDLKAATGADGYLVLYREGDFDINNSGINDGAVYADETELAATNANGLQYVDGGAAQEVEITGLNPKTEYSFRIIPYSYALDGGTPVSETYNYRTSSNAKLRSIFTSATFPPDPVSGFIKTSATSESVTFNWDDYTLSSGFSDNGGFLIYYEEYLNADPIDLSTIENGIAPASQLGLPSFVEVTTDNATEATVSGLDPATRYKFSIIPYNKEGSNNETIGYNVTGKPDINHYTLANPADNGADVVDDGTFNLDIISSSEITVNWSAVTGASGYLVLYTKSNSALDDSFLENGVNPINQPYPTGAGEVFYTDVTDGSTTTVNVSSLDDDTDYTFKVIPYTYSTEEETYNYNNSTPPFRSGTTLCVDPTETVADLATSNVAVNQMDISWTNASGLNVLAVARLNSSTKTVPTDGQDYTANATFTSGDQLGASGTFVVYEGTGTSFTLTGLDEYQEYSVDVYLFNDNGFCYEDNGVTLTQITDCDPATTTVSGTSTSGISYNEITVNWAINGAGNNVLVVARENTDPAVAPTSNTDYTEDPIFGNGQTTGTGNFTVYDGTGTSVTVTGLVELTDYSFDIYEYNPTRGGFCYNSTAVTENKTTVCQPPSTTATFDAATNLTAGSVDLNWNTATGADAYLIVAKQGATVDLTVNNGDDYTTDANNNFIDAVEISNGNKIVYSAAGTSATITGLTAATEYTFEIYAYVDGTFCYAFDPEAQSITTDAASASNTLSLNSAAPSINSVDNDENSNYITVMDFDMTDVGGDGIETRLASFAFGPGTGNDFANWTDLIQDAKIVNVTNSNEKAAASITANEIEFTFTGGENGGGGIANIPDNSTIQMQLQIRLKSTIALAEIDGLNFVFELDPSTITFQGNSSTFDTALGSEITTDATNNKVEVIATAFEFTTDPPSTVNAGENVSPQAVVVAKDANGNLDLDYGTFTISNAATIPMANLPEPPSFTNGEFEFPATFNYQGSGDGTLTITDGANLFDVTSIPITVNPTVDLTELTAGLNGGTLQSSSTDQAVLGFSIDALGSTQVNSIEFTTDADISGLVDNLRIVASTNNTTYEGIGTDLPIANTPNITGGNTITFSGLTENFSSEAKNYFLVLDVFDSVNVDLPPITFQLDINDIVFTNSANKNASSFSRQYNFEDVTKPEITEITATPTLLSGANLGTDALEIKVTFNEKMDDAIIPNIDFPTTGEDPLFTNSLSGPNANSSWSADSTFYTFLFDLADQNELMENIDISISNANDKYGNSLDAVAEANLFSIDTENPIADNISLDRNLVNRTDDTIELTVTFNKEMNDAIAPSFTVDNSTNLIENGDGAWSEAVLGEGFKVYTVTFTHDLGVEENITDKIIIQDAEDVAGNIMDLDETDPFTINTTRPRIDFITATNTTGIYKANDIIEIQVYFDQDITLDDALGTPELDLNSGGTAVFASAVNNIMTFNYTVLATENAALLDVSGFRLEGATIKNVGLNDAILTLPVDAADELSTRKPIEIDTQSPEIATTTITPSTVSQVNSTFTLEINYNEVMDQTSNPSFLPSDGNAINFQSGSWTDNQTYLAEFEHDLATEEEITAVTIEISDATDSVGNTAVTADSETFNIDTQSPRITEIVTTTTDGTYGPGEQINIRVVFDEDIQQTGTAPTLTLNTGATADYDNITNGNQLNFTYTIGAANSGENTLDLDVASISTSENEVLDLVNNPSVLTLPNAGPNRLIDFADIVIDTRPAEITNVTSTNVDPKYKAGETIAIVVTFDEVVTATGTPRIALNTGDYADYDSGSGSTELTFIYTVQNSDGTTLFDVLDLEYSDVNSLALNGGSIIDPASVPVDQTLPIIGDGNSLGDNTNIEIDTRDPEFTIDLDISMVDLNDLTLTVTTNYDEDMDTSTDPAYTFSTPNNLVKNDVGNWTDNRTYVETFTHDQTAEEISNITIEISGATDEVGNTAVTNTSDPFNIDTQRPEITGTSITPSTVSQANPTFVLEIRYNEEMDQTSSPNFLESAGNTINFLSGSWSDNQTYQAEFEHDLATEEEITAVTIEISDATDLEGNTAVTADSETFNIDTQSPRITEIVTTTTDGTYGPGEQINIRVVFDEDIQQTGTVPTLTLNTCATADYDNITNGNQLNFTYTIGAANSGENTLDLDVTSISTSENEVLDLVNNPSVLTLPNADPNRLIDFADIVIDTRPAEITNVTSTNIDGKYKAGDNIAVVVTFDELVTVSGTPRIALNTGDYAEFTGGSGTNELTFNYTVQNSDGTTLFDVLDLEYSDVNSLELNGGSIIDPASVPVDQTLPTTNSGNSLSDNTNIEIDTRDPEFTIDLDISMVDLNDLTLTVTTNYDEDMDTSTDPSYTLSQGANLIQDNAGAWTDNRTYVETFTHNENEEELSNITVEISGATDEVGNTAVTNTSDPFDIDTQKPRITQITSTSSGIYGPGEVIDIKVTFDEDVQQTGTTPTLNLNSTGEATFVDITNGNEVNFSYTIGAVNSNENTGDLTVDSFSSSENEVLDLQANPSVLDLPGANNLGDNANIIIDTDPADVTNITANPTSGIFKAGDEIDIIITFNETVLVDETDGTPQLLLNTGSYAEYTSGSNSTELTFTYTVASAGGSIVDVLDLDYVDENSLELNGGLILDLAGVNANLELPATGDPNSLGENTDIEIDTTSPTVTIDLDNTVITIANNQLVLTATYSEDMDTSQPPTLTVQGSNRLILDNGSTWNSTTNEYTASFTHNLTEEELENVTIEVSGGTDVVGNTSITNASETITIDTQRPRILEIVSTSDNGLYSPGDNINIQLVFDEDVTVGGSPTLELNSGDEAIAVFDNVSGNEVNFVYTVGGVNSGENTLDLDVTAFNMNGGNIRDLVNNDAEIELPSEPDRLQDNADIQIDSDPADIVKVEANPESGFFTVGDQIDIIVEFDEPVVVTGTPLLSLNTGSNAEYVSGSNSTFLTFNYTVEASNGTSIFDVTELDYESIGSITLNGGSIEDLAGISGNLGLPAPGSANSLNGNTVITIDTEEPELANDPFRPFNGEFNVSHSLLFKIEMNEPVSGQGTNNITIREKETSNVLVVLDGATAFSNNTSDTLVFETLEEDGLLLLQDTTEYYIEFEPGALIDRAGNPFAGFTADDIWSFTTFGPPRIDSFSIGACVGGEFIIEGQYFTGVTQIRTNIDGDQGSTISSDDFVIVDDRTIRFNVPAGTVPGRITLDKESGEGGNTEDASTTSIDPIKVGPSSAQLVLVNSEDAAICDIDDLGNENEVEFAVDIVGGNGVYTLIYSINGVEQEPRTGFEADETFSVIPPDSGINEFTILSLIDEDEDFEEECSAPDLGSTVEINKFINSRVDAGGIETEDEEFGVIELCAETNILDFSKLSLVTNLPQITGTVTQGTWSIDEGPSSNGGGFSPDFNLKTVQTDRPDTVKYYASFGDGVRGQITLKLTADDPDEETGNPCTGANDFVIVKFSESLSANTDRSVFACAFEDDNGQKIAETQLSSSVTGGIESDSLTVLWQRIDTITNEADNFDGTWGFKDDENQEEYSLTSNVLNPIYKASPQEVENERANLTILPVLVSGEGCGEIPDPRDVTIVIRDIPNPSLSEGPEIVCSGEERVAYEMTTSDQNNTFEWSFLNENGNEFRGAINRNIVFIDFREVEIEVTDTLIVTEIDASTGCISEPDTFYISLKPRPKALILYEESTTISQQKGLTELIGAGIVGLDSVSGPFQDSTYAEGESFVFSGPGVIQNSSGEYFLDASQLSTTSLTDENEFHEIFFTYTNEFGCSATTSLKFNVFSNEQIFINLEAQYCEVDTEIPIEIDPGIVLALSDSADIELQDILGPGISDVKENLVIESEDTIRTLTALFNPETAYADNQNPEGSRDLVKIQFSFLNLSTGNLEINEGQDVRVNPLPEMEIEPIPTNLCTDDGNIEFEPVDIAGNNFSFELLNDSDELPDSLLIGDSLTGFEFNPRPLLDALTALNKDSIRIFVKYTYRDQNTCENSREYSFVVWRQPSKPALESQNLCIVDGVIDMAKVINYNIAPGEEDNSEEELFWLPSPNFTTDEDIVLGTGKTFTPTEDQLSSGTSIFYVFRINVNSSGEQDQSCVSAPTRVNFRRIQNPDFSWDKSTFGEEDIIFTGEPNQTNLDTAATFWTIKKIGDGEVVTVLEEDITSVNDSSIAVNFNDYGAGRYMVSFNVSSTTTFCSGVKTNEVLILPEAQADNGRYIFDFDGSTEGWISDGLKIDPEEDDTLDRVWDFAIPSGNSNFQSNESIWVTNSEGSYESGIDSYVYSPAMDITGITRPVVSFDLWTNMAAGQDGLILEYSTDEKRIEDDTKVWQILGGLSSGLEWYNNDDINALSLISNNGWSVENDSSSIIPVNAKHTLEGIENKESVMFRFRFKSVDRENEFGNRDGAAFDNFRVESLNRNVLVEYFGDYTSDNDIDEMNAINNEFITTGNFAWLNYRINENDPLYKQQSSAMLSRIYYYDAYELADQFAMDGILRTEFTFDDAGANDLSRARLFSSISTIDIDVSLVNEDELGINVGFQSVDPLDDDVNLFIAVLQKEVIGGEDSSVTYYNVLRKLLPGNSGIEVSGTSGEHSVNFIASRDSDEQPLAVVAFLQNVNNSQVIQSAYIDGFSELTVQNVTSTDNKLDELDIKLYPNPAHDNLNIQWGIPLQEEAKAKVIDVTGKIIKDFRLEKGERYYELNTSSLKTGMYNLILTNQKGEHKMLKFAVTN